MVSAYQQRRMDVATRTYDLKQLIEREYVSSRERSLALTKLDEVELWLGRANLVIVDDEPPAAMGTEPK